MGKYLKKFETHTQYEVYTADTENFILPNVSYCEDVPNEVHYNPYIDPYNGHEYVDLGLPSGTKWATMNIGASSATAYGNYYQYGKGASQYSATSGQSNYSGTENPLATSADTAAQLMGGQWHMPTDTQYQELIDNTTNEWTTIGGVNGYKFTATNGNYVFFPAAGYWYDGRQYSSGGYWSSTHYSDDGASILDFEYGVEIGQRTKNSGYSVRGVVG